MVTEPVEQYGRSVVGTESLEIVGYNGLYQARWLFLVKVGAAGASKQLVAHLVGVDRSLLWRLSAHSSVSELCVRTSLIEALPG